jgi:hypothetical protein
MRNFREDSGGEGEWRVASREQRNRRIFPIRYSLFRYSPGFPHSARTARQIGIDWPASRGTQGSGMIKASD